MMSNLTKLSVIPQFNELLFTSILLLLLSACTNEPGQTGSRPPPPQVTVAKPLVKVVTDWDEFTGRLAAVESVEVRARVSGYLQSVNFREGSIVQKDDLLYVIDPRPYQATLDASKAELSRAQASLQLAENDLKRAQRLIKSKTISEEELDARTQQRRKAVATLELARASVRAAQLNLEFTHIHSPVVGRISRTLVTPGNLVDGGDSSATLLTTIVSLDPIHFYISADEQQYLRYLRMARAGERQSSRDVHNPARLRLADETDFVHEGYMDFVDNQIDEATGTMIGRAVFPNPDLILVPGMFAELQLYGAGPYESLQIPDTAISFDQAEEFVFVVDKSHVVQRRVVSMGRIDDGLRIIKTGLSKEDEVVINGIQRIRAGMTVAPQTASIQTRQSRAGVQ